MDVSPTHDQSPSRPARSDETGVESSDSAPRSAGIRWSAELGAAIDEILQEAERERDLARQRALEQKRKLARYD